MTDRAIIFRGSMVRTILDGRKTQTRRTVNLGYDYAHSGQEFEELRDRIAFFRGLNSNMIHGVRCPYGQSGDRLWVRETFALSIEDPDTESRDVKDPMLWDTPIYKANPVAGEWERDGRRLSRPPWRSPRYMPRWASRITLDVKSVRVERVQDITHGDVFAEGIGSEVPRKFSQAVTQGAEFETLWNSINAKRGHGWDANPWVWVVGFEMVRI